MIQPAKELQTAIDAAIAGGKVAMSYFQKDLEIHLKKDASIQTQADIDTEEAIKQHILTSYPEATFVAEESGGDEHADSFWIIDPIDGTRIYTRKIPLWSILIAHYEKGEITSGVCYIPAQNMLLAAEKGNGASLNGKQIFVSKKTEYQGSFGSFGSIQRFHPIDPVLTLTASGVVMRSYEHAFALTFLASGQMDVVIDGYGTPWDYAPFVCIIPEAGGKVTDLQGNPWNLQTKSLLATNGVLHDQIVKIINEK